ncbi:MAG: hypothetical protein NT062_38475 [Proteobacteria bacterium]|nr:hypothetical protein [Pseudomonadota bacterium]
MVYASAMPAAMTGTNTMVEITSVRRPLEGTTIVRVNTMKLA